MRILCSEVIVINCQEIKNNDIFCEQGLNSIKSIILEMNKVLKKKKKTSKIAECNKNSKNARFWHEMLAKSWLLAVKCQSAQWFCVMRWFLLIVLGYVMKLDVVLKIIFHLTSNRRSKQAGHPVSENNF